VTAAVVVILRRRRKEGVEPVLEAVGLLTGCLETRFAEGVLNGVVTVVVDAVAVGLAWREWDGVVEDWKKGAVVLVRLDWGVTAKRAVVGVRAVIGGRGSVVRGLLGVAARRVPLAAGADSLVDLDGVRPSRSKMPRTRPSFWGVGLIEVGTAATGVRTARLRDGVRTAWAAEGVWAPDGTASTWECVWADLYRLEGVCGGRSASDCVRLCWWWPWVASTGPGRGGGALPASISRSLLYCLYFRASSSRSVRVKTSDKRRGELDSTHQCRDSV
jgi:hypothetical protein